ncbi:unnamed protein product [Cuscuta epithymum]|uniref:Cyclin n=1 Tax=Cuscuta epithymum TaxID=186058 RepID=A0AAV0GBH9_9ASTE|nr:unnamed protein product [Cuscuta epithymum]
MGGGAQAQALHQGEKESITTRISATDEFANLLGLAENDKNSVGPPKIVSVLGSVLEKTMKKNEKQRGGSSVSADVTVFHGSRAPSMSVGQYVDRIFRYSNCSPACFVVSYIYLDRFVARTGAVLTSLNVHRLLITSTMLAAKFLDDGCYNNGYYAKVGGISNSELNKLEMKFLTALQFRLHVSVDTFISYCALLEKPERPVNPPRVRTSGFRKYLAKILIVQ